MQTRFINLNCDANEYKFDMSKISNQEWIDMAHTIVLAKGQRIKALELQGIKVVVRDNKTKFKIFFQDSTYHEHEYHLDVFGRISRNYKDIVSELLQETMEHHYGQEYRDALDKKLAELNPAIQK